MRSHFVAAIAAAATVILSVGCSTPSSSMGASPSSGTPSAEERQCQVFRSYARDRAISNVMEECARQMGVEACKKCLGLQ